MTRQGPPGTGWPHRLFGETRPFLLVDTGGLLLDGTDEMEEKVRDQVQVAMADADLLLFLTDAATGLHPVDAEVADLLRRQDKPVILAVNKCDSERRGMGVAEFYRLGLGQAASHQRAPQTGGPAECWNASRDFFLRQSRRRRWKVC